LDGLRAIRKENYHCLLGFTEVRITSKNVILRDEKIQDMELNNKIIWITGASSGIGEALCYELAGRCEGLILSARRVDELERVKKNCAAALQDRIFLLPLDLASSEQLEQKVQEALGYFGRVDIMVHNGGISQRSLAAETKLEVDRRLFEVNYFGTITLTKHLIPSMLERGSGTFMVVSSMVGKYSTPKRSGYSATKMALHGFFDALRAENKNLNVCMVCPGFIKTNLSYNALTGSGEKQNKMDNAQARGISAAFCASQMRKALEKETPEIYVAGLKEKFGLFVSRFFPGLFRKLIRRISVT
jgi:short-subunit dehydrogenase